MNDRYGGDPAHRITQRLTSLLRLESPGLHPQQRGYCLEIVLDPVMDLADGGVLGDEHTITGTQVCGIPAEHQRAHLLALDCQRQDDNAHGGPRLLDVKNDAALLREVCLYRLPHRLHAPHDAPDESTEILISDITLSPETPEGSNGVR